MIALSTSSDIPKKVESPMPVRSIHFPPQPQLILLPSVSTVASVQQAALSSGQQQSSTGHPGVQQAHQQQQQQHTRAPGSEGLTYMHIPSQQHANQTKPVLHDALPHPFLCWPGQELQSTLPAASNSPAAANHPHKPLAHMDALPQSARPLLAQPSICLPPAAADNQPTNAAHR